MLVLLPVGAIDHGTRTQYWIWEGACVLKTGYFHTDKKMEKEREIRAKAVHALPVPLKWRGLRRAKAC